VRIPADGVTLEGNLVVPEVAKGIVLFAHGSGSSRFSPRNRYVAEVLNSVGLATLLMDLLTKEEERIDIESGRLRFDIDLLSTRIMCATQWLMSNARTRNLAIGYFGSSTGAAAALIAAAKLPHNVSAVVSRGGRPDLAKEYLAMVKAPTLFIVGGDDEAVIEMNKEAIKYLDAEKRLEIVPGATHLFEEPGALEAVARLAADWFVCHL
jgi:dienelactone hydrolase